MTIENKTTGTFDLLEIERNARAMQAKVLADMVRGLGRMIAAALRRRPAATHA